MLLPADKKVNNVPVYYFRTYVGAARKAFREKLMGEDELIRVVKQAQKELESVPRYVCINIYTYTYIHT